MAYSLQAVRISPLEWIIPSKSNDAIALSVKNNSVSFWRVISTTQTPNSNNFRCNCPAFSLTKNGVFFGKRSPANEYGDYPCIHILAVCIVEGIDFTPVFTRSITDNLDGLAIAPLNSTIELAGNTVSLFNGAEFSNLESRFLDKSCLLGAGNIVNITAPNIDFTSDDYTIEFFQYVRDSAIASPLTFDFSGIAATSIVSSNQWLYTKFIRNGLNVSVSIDGKVIASAFPVADTGEVLLISVNGSAIALVDVNPDPFTTLRITGLTNTDFPLGIFYSELRVSSWAKRSETIIKSSFLVP
jgi:hypothetical protein